MKYICYAFLISLFVGCSSTDVITPTKQMGSFSYSEFNERMRWLQAKVDLINNRSFIAREINVQLDSTSFLDVSTNGRQVVSTIEIYSITRNNRDAGRDRGILTGAAMGIVAGTIAHSFTSPGSGYELAVTIGLIASGAILGSAVGNVVGSAVGFSEKYVIMRDTLQAPLKDGKSGQ